METLDDFLPKFLIDYLDQSTTRDYQVVQFEEIQHGLCHDGQTVDGSSCKVKSAKLVVDDALVSR